MPRPVARTFRIDELRRYSARLKACTAQIDSAIEAAVLDEMPALDVAVAGEVDRGFRILELLASGAWESYCRGGASAPDTSEDGSKSAPKRPKKR